MSTYDNRRITLDPGLTVLALRGVHKRHEQYPFVERHVRGRRRSLALRRSLSAWFPTIVKLMTVHTAAG